MDLTPVNNHGVSEHDELLYCEGKAKTWTVPIYITALPVFVFVVHHVFAENQNITKAEII